MVQDIKAIDSKARRSGDQTCCLVRRVAWRKGIGFVLDADNRVLMSVFVVFTHRRRTVEICVRSLVIPLKGIMLYCTTSGLSGKYGSICEDISELA